MVCVAVKLKIVRAAWQVKDGVYWLASGVCVGWQAGWQVKDCVRAAWQVKGCVLAGKLKMVCVGWHGWQVKDGVCWLAS